MVVLVMIADTLKNEGKMHAQSRNHLMQIIQLTSKHPLVVVDQLKVFVYYEFCNFYTGMPQISTGNTTYKQYKPGER